MMFLGGASTKSAARSRQDAMVERREATRVRKARDHGFHVAPFGAPLPSLGGKEKKEGAPAPTKQQGRRSVGCGSPLHAAPPSLCKAIPPTTLEELPRASPFT
jgi:hypothetical protein